MQPLRLLFLGLIGLGYSGISGAAPPTPGVNVVNVIPLESMIPLGDSHAVSSDTWYEVHYTNVPPGWIHSLNVSLASASDSYCTAHLEPLILTDGSVEVTQVEALVAQGGNNSMSQDFSTPIQVDFDDSISDFYIGLKGTTGPSATGGYCLVSLGGVYEVDEEAMATASSMETIRVLREEHPE